MLGVARERVLQVKVGEQHFHLIKADMGGALRLLQLPSIDSAVSTRTKDDIHGGGSR